MNKRNILITLLLLFTLILSACASSKSSTSSSETTGKLPTQTKLILGTINLEGTDYAVTAEQAKDLLPMFYVLQELNDSKFTSQEEVDGLVDQVQQTLTDDQIKTINDMSLSIQDILAVTQSGSVGSATSKASSTSGTGGAAGGPPEMGGMPGGAPSEITGSTGTTSASSTSPVSVMDSSAKIPSSLFDTAIELLKTKVEY
jgi:ABC-type Fe3+-hydroxamate transport system substrate-binding protein